MECSLTGAISAALSILVLLWAAWMMLRSRLLAALAVVPLASALLFACAISPYPYGESKRAAVSALCAAGLAVWLKAHLTGRGTARLAVLVVGFLCAVSAALEQKALLVAAAFAAYLALYSKGRWRLLKPLAVAAIVVGTYLMMHPATLLHLNAGPWDVGPGTILRRFNSLWTHLSRAGTFSSVKVLTDSLFFWPILPAAGVAVWASRRERWFPVAACFGLSLSVAAVFSMLLDWNGAGRHSDPAMLGLCFVVSVFVLSATARLLGAETPKSQADGCRPPVTAAESALQGTPGRSRLALAATLALFAALLSSAAVMAAKAETLGIDEGIWFMRSRVPPYDLSTEEHRLWAIEVPAANRWIYLAVLRATGLDEIPADEKCPWSLRDGRIYWKNRSVEDSVNKLFHDDGITFEKWLDWAGRYAPRKAILAMRAVNVAAFAAYLVLIWLCARTALGSCALSTLILLPIAFSPTMLMSPSGMAFYVSSGDIFMITAIAGGLLVWLRRHMRGQGAACSTVILVALLFGVATGCKQHALLALWAFMAYLAWRSRGWRRVTNPLIAAVVAAVVFFAVNPAMLTYPGARPWDVVLMVARRRALIVSRYVFSVGRIPLPQFLGNDFAWWPILPIICTAAWACRRQKWFAPVAFSCSFLIVGTVAGLLKTRMMVARYLAPLELGLYFVAGVCIVTVSLCRSAACDKGPAETEGISRASAAGGRSDATASNEPMRRARGGCEND